jgi:hypothetical protein
MIRSCGETCFTTEIIGQKGPWVSGFDEEITWCKERRASAIGDLREFCTGSRQFRNKVDITAVLETQASRDIKKFETIILALESYEKRESKA